MLEYNGNPDSDEKIVFVGKGITFDTGGVNTKGYHMEGMKYDMSGSVIVAYALKSLAELKVKKNVACYYVYNRQQNKWWCNHFQKMFINQCQACLLK